MEALKDVLPDLAKATWETACMLGIGLSIAALFGSALGVFLFLWKKGGLRESPLLYWGVGSAVNLVRSFPFVILMIAVSPATRILAGSSIGPVAASIPLSIAAIAYWARLVELALSEIPPGVLEAARAMGATLPQTVFRILLVEAAPALVLGFTALTVSYLSYSAVAGIVGGGGIGDLAIRYGYYRFQTEVMAISVGLLVITVQLIQFAGSRISRRLDRR